MASATAADDPTAAAGVGALAASIFAGLAVGLAAGLAAATAASFASRHVTAPPTCEGGAPEFVTQRRHQAPAPLDNGTRRPGKRAD